MGIFLLKLAGFQMTFSYTKEQICSRVGLFPYQEQLYLRFRFPIKPDMGMISEKMYT